MCLCLLSCTDYAPVGLARQGYCYMRVPIVLTYTRIIWYALCMINVEVARAFLNGIKDTGLPYSVVTRYFKYAVMHDDPKACWEWLGSKRAGYGKFMWQDPVTKKEKLYTAHRVAYRLFTGNDPGSCLMHLCDNKQCSNPSHLIPGNSALNNEYQRACKVYATCVTCESKHMP